MLKKVLATLAAIVCSGVIALSANLSLLSNSSGCSEGSQMLSCLNQVIGNINTGVNGTLFNATADSAVGAVTAETTLYTYSMPATVMAANGNSVRVTCWGATGATANNKTMKLYFGSTSIATPTQASNAQNWFLRYVAVRRTATTQSVFGEGVAGTGSLTPVAATSQAGTETLTAAVTIKCTGTQGTASAADITGNGMLVEQLK